MRTKQGCRRETELNTLARERTARQPPRARSGGILAQPYTRRSTLIAVRRQKMTGNPRIGDVAPPRGRLLSEPSLRTSHFSLFTSQFSVASPTTLPSSRRSQNMCRDVDAGDSRRALRNPRQAGRRRHGPGLPRHRHETRSQRRAEKPPSNGDRGSLTARAVRSRSADARFSEPSAHRPDLRN